MTKMTYVNALDMAINGTLTAEGIEKLEALKASLEKRNANRSHKPTKTQRENEALRAEVTEFLRDKQGMQCKDIASQFGVSGQKMSALLNQLVDGKIVKKFTEKRVTYFKIAEGV